MTDTMPEQTTDEQGWDGETGTPAVTYPEGPDNPHNHRFTISFDGRGPMVVVRGNTAADIIAAYQELEQSAAGAAMGNAWASIKAAAAVASGLGATPVPAGAPVAPQAPGMPVPPPFGPNVSVPAAPGFQGNPGFQPPQAPPPAQNQWGGQQAPQGPSPEYAQAGWYRLTVPFPQKGAFDAITVQHQMRKGRPTEGGSFSFQKADKSWYVSPQYAGAFPQFNPVPA
jgi:hypothetical protein